MDGNNPLATGVPKSKSAAYRENEELQEYSESSDCSDSSSEKPRDIDAVIREDMRKLECIFHSMGFKFRMIDRIGEGKHGSTY